MFYINLVLFANFCANLKIFYVNIIQDGLVDLLATNVKKDAISLKLPSNTQTIYHALFGDMMTTWPHQYKIIADHVIFLAAIIFMSMNEN